MCLSTNAATTFGRPEVTVERGRQRGRNGGQRVINLTVTMKISPINGLVFSSAAVGGMNSAHFDNFLAQARTSLDIKEEVIFAYDGVPAH